MNITFILPEINGGGIATYYRNLIPALTGAGHYINVILGDYKRDITNHDFPCNVIQITESNYVEGLSKYKALDIFSGIQSKVALSHACYQEASKLKSDIIEITDYNLLFYSFITRKIAPVIIRLAGSTGQLELHEQRTNDKLQSSFIISLEHTLLNHADYVIGISQLNINYWNQFLHKKAILHLPYLKYADSEKSQVTKFNNKEGRGIIVGRVQLWKGALFLSEFYRKYPDAPGVDWVGGDNYYLEYHHSMIAHLQKTYPDVIGNKIAFKGRMPYQEAQRLIDMADFVLVPSTWDTFNFVVTEAMWKGKVVIASTGAGATELVQNGINGFVYENNDLDSLMNIFNSYLNSTEKQLNEIQQEASSSVQRMLSNTAILKERINAFETVKKMPINQNNTLAFIQNSFINQSSKQLFEQRIGLKRLIKLGIGKIKVFLK